MDPEERIATILAEWRDRHDEGERLDVEDVIAQHPELEGELREHFAALEILDLAVLETLDATGQEGPRADPAQIGPYRLLRLLGSGGMGRVYLAEQEEPIRRRVALKIIAERVLDPKLLARFAVECEALARMDHPYIASVHDAGVDAHGAPYVAMAYVDGLPITTFCSTNDLPLRGRLELMAKLCEAVQHAHQKGVIHRDIKPTNVLVAEVDGSPTPRVIDFGLAKARDHVREEAGELTLDSQILGTPSYMSPEQAAGGQSVDARSDVYALGVLLHELLTGEAPWGSAPTTPNDVAALIRRILDEEPPKPSSKLGMDTASEARSAPDSTSSIRERDLRGDLDWIVLRAMARNPEDRYASAQNLADDLRRFLRDEPVEAGPPSSGYRLRKFVRRHRLAVGAALAVAMSLAAGLIVGVRQHGVVVDARVQAESAKERAIQARGEAESLMRFFHDEVRTRVLAMNDFELIHDFNLRRIDYWTRRFADAPNPETHLRLGRALLDDARSAYFSRDPRRALERTREISADAEAALREQPDARPLQELLGRALSQEGQVLAVKGEVASAIEQQKRAIQLLEAAQVPLSVVASSKYSLAECLRLEGDADSAEALLRAILPQQVESERVKTLVALAEVAHARGATGEALEFYGSSLAEGEELLRASPSTTLRRLVAHAHLRTASLATGRGESTLHHARAAHRAALRLLEREPDVGPWIALRVDAAGEVGSVLHGLGRFSEAVAALQDATTAAEKLLEVSEPGGNAAHSASEAYMSLGAVQYEGLAHAESLRAMDRALEIVQAALEEQPNHVSLRTNRSVIQGTRASALLALKRPEEGLRAARACWDDAKALAAQQPESLEKALLATQAGMNLEQILYKTGRPSNPQVVKDAHEMSRRLAAAGYTHWSWFQQYGAFQYFQAYRLMNADSLQEAAAAFRQSIATLQLAKRAPVAPYIQDAKQQLASLELELGEREPETPSECEVRARILLVQQKYLEALRLYRRALADATHRKDPRHFALYNGACAAARASETAEPVAARALRVEALGYLREDIANRTALWEKASASGDTEALARMPNLKRHLEHARVKDPDITSLRGEEGFKALFAE